MRRLLVSLCLLFSLTALRAAEVVAPSTEKAPVLVLVHGAWAGGWQYRKVTAIFESHGIKVFHPSMSGMGEHHNTASPAIGLDTHIDDIVNLILFEDLHDVILLGHSYGGMVVTGVVDRIPERIKKVIYLDAFVPEDGESLTSLRKPVAGFNIETMTKDGMIVPSWVKPEKPWPKDVPQPLKTFTDPIHLGNPAAKKIPGVYILTVDKGKQPQDDEFYAPSERARARGWPVLLLEANHVPQWYIPEVTAALIEAQLK